MPPKISIGIPTYGGSTRMEWCLRSIYNVSNGRGLEAHDAHIVLLDDGSKDGGEGVRILGQKYGVPTIVFPNNRGIPAAWNALTDHYNADITILLNDDIIVTPGWLEAMVYFLENNPKAGFASWIFYFTKDEDMPKLLNGESVIPRDPITKEPKPEKIGECEGARPGRIMCPSGCCFAFKREMYELVREYNKTIGLTGCFPEEFISFHEESHAGTVLAKHGFSSYGLTSPHLWHIWSATFGASPELNAAWRMQHSRAMYCKAWDVPPEFHQNPFNYTNPLLMPKIPPNLVKWMDPQMQPREELEIL